jgi:hypothetical protein
MTPTQIFGLQVLVNLIVYGLAARWYLAPQLARLPLVDALTPLLLFQALRTMGLVFLLPEVVGAPLPAAFAVPAAYGDLLAVGLALLALIALRRDWPGALVLVWAFSVAGLLDFVNAFGQGLRLDLAAGYALGFAWFIPTFAVPAFTVGQVLILAVLIQRGSSYRAVRHRRLDQHGL